jgi:2,3-bisphosphoglycerate-dependent phosphoglycerate mutase
MSYLVLIRHGETDWNSQGLFSGQTDIPLNEVGKDQARKAASLLGDITFQKGYTSNLSRAQDTLKIVLNQLGINNLEVIEDKALTERNYGIFEGKNKQETAATFGKDEVKKIRRAWDHPVKDGETLKDVHSRLVPFYEKHILADLRAGKNVIIAGHNNSLRALIKHLELMSASEVEAFELNNAELYIYQMSNSGKVLNKEVRKI